MTTEIVFTLTGKDRVGLVDQVTQVLLDRGGNIQASRMAHLGGEFAMLMLVAVPSQNVAPLESDVAQWRAQGYQVTLTPTQGALAGVPANSTAYAITVEGADHEGIIHEVAHYLAQWGINIEEMTTETMPAPITGQPLFAMSALVIAPATLQSDWQTQLGNVAQHLNVDIRVNAAHE